jgi:hypothetical protein
VIPAVLRVNGPSPKHVQVLVQRDQGIPRPGGKGGPGPVVRAHSTDPVEHDLSQGLSRDRHPVILPRGAAGRGGRAALAVPE